jgi:hypothetical protein
MLALLSSWKWKAAQQVEELRNNLVLFINGGKPTYHVAQRPGRETERKLRGGLHRTKRTEPEMDQLFRSKRVPAPNQTWSVQFDQISQMIIRTTARQRNHSSVNSSNRIREAMSWRSIPEV